MIFIIFINTIPCHDFVSVTDIFELTWLLQQSASQDLTVFSFKIQLLNNKLPRSISIFLNEFCFWDTVRAKLAGIKHARPAEIWVCDNSTFLPATSWQLRKLWRNLLSSSSAVLKLNFWSQWVNLNLKELDLELNKISESTMIYEKRNVEVSQFWKCY